MEITQKLLNNIGLIMNITGVIITFKHALPNAVQKYSKNIIYSKPSKSEIMKILYSGVYSYIGIILILLGFVFQLASNNL
ncbi:hypothetical protein [Polaribacter sargassicola]|uniref:hypothetical protein n=1 Tax=Polaribacter sargassicola TaxID=2836891 RepID=UPI001F26CEA1|nr:hypothetical protein [Polaribacter sp. DS7-9]MCG1037068.1 hypothetical protein [Polaribacter sp. DS7-9]